MTSKKSSHENVAEQVKSHILIFAALLFLTLVAVTIHYLHLNVTLTVCMILGIALVKGSLVGGYMMHFLTEKTFMFAIAIITGLFFLSVVLLPLWGHYNTL